MLTSCPIEEILKRKQESIRLLVIYIEDGFLSWFPFPTLVSLFSYARVEEDEIEDPHNRRINRIKFTIICGGDLLMNSKRLISTAAQNIR